MPPDGESIGRRNGGARSPANIACRFHDAVVLQTACRHFRYVGTQVPPAHGINRSIRNRRPACANAARARLLGATERPFGAPGAGGQKIAVPDRGEFSGRCSPMRDGRRDRHRYCARSSAPSTRCGRDTLTFTPTRTVPTLRGHGPALARRSRETDPRATPPTIGLAATPTSGGARTACAQRGRSRSCSR
jgi:hypothetical protein